MSNPDLAGKQRYELHQRVPESALALAHDSLHERHADSLPGQSRRVGPELILLDREIPDHRIYQAETFHRLYREQTDNRQAEIRSFYEELGRPDNIVVMMFCRNYFRMFENWLASCSANGINPLGRLIVYCLDGEAFRLASGLGVKSYFLDPDLYTPAGRSESFGDEWFRNTVLYKNAIIHDALDLGAAVLYQDTDMVWLKDPFEYLEHGREYYDMQIMYDGLNPAGRPVYGNTGFIYLQSNPVTRSLFETALRNSAAILTAGAHQFVFMRILRFFLEQRILRLHILPEHMFLNGHLFNLERGVLPPAKNWKADGVVFHYSWTGNRHEKTSKLNAFGFDYLDPQATGEALPGTRPDHAMTTRETAMNARNEDLYTVVLYLKDGEKIELDCEKTSPVLEAILKSFFQSERGGNDPASIHLQLMEDDECCDLFLRASEITRVEVAPPLDPRTLARCTG